MTKNDRCWKKIDFRLDEMDIYFQQDGKGIRNFAFRLDEMHDFATFVMSALPTQHLMLTLFHLCCSHTSTLVIDFVDKMHISRILRQNQKYSTPLALLALRNQN